MSDVRKLIAEARSLIKDCDTYRFGMWSADRLAHDVAGRLVGALEAATSPVEPALSTTSTRLVVTAEGGRVRTAAYTPHEVAEVVAGYVADGYDSESLEFETITAAPSPVEPELGDREALVEVLDDTGVRCGGDNCGGGPAECCFCEDTIASYVEAILTAGFSRPTKPETGDREALMSMMNNLYSWSTMNWDEIADAILAAGFSRPAEPETGGREALAQAALAEATRLIPPEIMVFHGGATRDLNDIHRKHFIEGALWAASRPVGGETETEAAIQVAATGVLMAEFGRVTPDAVDALARTVWPSHKRVVTRQVTPWLPVSPEQDGGKA